MISLLYESRPPYWLDVLRAMPLVSPAFLNIFCRGICRADSREWGGNENATVMLVNDYAAVRSRYKRHIELDPSLQVTAETDGHEEAYAQPEQTSVDVVIKDLRCPARAASDRCGAS